jgi:hypothetical protein
VFIWDNLTAHHSAYVHILNCPTAAVPSKIRPKRVQNL